jgi:hypothetical protein
MGGSTIGIGSIFGSSTGSLMETDRGLPLDFLVGNGLSVKITLECINILIKLDIFYLI